MEHLTMWRSLAAALATDPRFLAHEFAWWRRLCPVALTEALGADVDTVLRLAVCRRPRAGRYRSDLQDICAHAGADPDALGRVLVTVGAGRAIVRFCLEPPSPKQRLFLDYPV